MCWTDENYAQAKKMWKAGKTATEIANTLQTTRNAVLGKLHRDGELGGRRIVPREVEKPGPGVPKHGGRRNHVVQLDRKTVKPPTPVKFHEPVLPVSTRVTLEELSPNHCRFPIGDPLTGEFRYCGGPRLFTSQGSFRTPYCAEHAKVAYVPPHARKPRTQGQKDGDMKRRVAMLKKRSIA